MIITGSSYPANTKRWSNVTDMPTLQTADQHSHSIGTTFIAYCVVRDPPTMTLAIYKDISKTQFNYFLLNA